MEKPQISSVKMETEMQKKPINIKGISYLYIKERLMGGSIYANQERSAYLRTNGAAEISGEINITRELSERGFPVPHVLGSGTLEDGNNYFIEESIGDKVFADIFNEETKAAEHARDETFEAFTAVVKKYCEAQFNPTNYVAHDKEALASMTALANVMRNNPPSAKMRELFMQAYEKAAERVLSLPWGYVQADLNAYNILPDGIIDFELARFGPIGYDALTNIYFNIIWPKEKIRYRFSKEQVARYIAEIDAVAKACNLPAISSYTDDFLVLKNIWGSGKDKTSEEHPERDSEFWSWRVQVRDWCIRQYLKGEKIDTDLFEAVGKGNIK
jgi:aminoglycoside/choline kinase family phosphotransferase